MSSIQSIPSMIHVLQSYLAHVRGQVGLSITIPKLWLVGEGRGGGGEWLSSSL